MQFRGMAVGSSAKRPAGRGCGFRLVTGGMFVLWAASAAVGQGTGVDQARVREIAAMLPERPAGVGRPIGDRAAWDVLKKQDCFQAVLAEAEKLLNEPLPQTTDELYLDFSRTGNRTRWQDVMFERRGRLNTLVLAECLENRGRFLPAFVETLKSICKEPTWIFPAHDGNLANFKGEQTDIDLASSALAWVLGTADGMLGEKLEPQVRQLIREQVRRRVFDSYEQTVTGKRAGNWWLVCTNNWNAVCLAGVTGAAMSLIDSPQERAFYAAAAEQYSKHFLEGFTADGYCSEGVSYWNYGFGHYVLLAETLIQATGGRLNLLAGEHVRQIALYGLESEIAPGVYPSFADCFVDARPGQRLLTSLAWRWGFKPADEPAKESLFPKEPLYSSMIYAFGQPPAVTQPSGERWAGLGLRTWFEQGGVFIGRCGAIAGCRLAVAIKGGHNAEHHNHNDVGSYIVVADGRLVLTDPGAEVYTRRTFSGQRYDSKAINSFGHPVPTVAGELQQSGREAQGQVVRTEFTDRADTLVFDIRSAYALPELEKLERTFVYSRDGGGSLAVTDEVVFTQPRAFGTALVTFGQFKQTGPGQLLIADGDAAVGVKIEAEGGEIEIAVEEIHEDLVYKRTPTRIGVTFKEPIGRGRITVMIGPSDERIKEPQPSGAGK